MKQETKICEFCHREHDGSYGSGRFCSKSCATRHKAWNKGLTKETNSKIAESAARLRQRYISGELKGSWIGRHHTEKTKEQLSELGRNNPYQRKCKKTLPYIRKDGSVVNLDSSFERYVAKFLDENNIEWYRPSPLKWYDSQGKEHNYFADFYLPNLDVYLDPKNSYCFQVQREKIDYIKKHYSNVIFLTEKELNEKELKKILT